MSTQSRERRELSARVLAIMCFLAAAGLLSSCSASRIADSLPPSLGGLPEGVPERPAVQPEYPAVHDLPPPRADSTLSEAEKKSLKNELITTRERAVLRAGAKKTETTTKRASAKRPESSDSGNPQSAGTARNP